MKRFVLYIIFALMPLAGWADYSFYSGGFYFRIVSDELSTVYVCNKGNTSTDCYSGSITVPQNVSYNNRRWTITGVADSCFYKCTGVTSLTLPSTVLYVGVDASEGCTALSQLTLKGDAGSRQTSVRIMDKENFHYVTTLSLDRNISTASYSGLFQSVKSVSLGENVLFIPQEAFSSSTALASLTAISLCPPQFQGDYSRNFPSSLSASSISVTVPGGDGVMALYKNSNVWSSLTNMTSSGSSLISLDADGYYQLSTADQLLFFSRKVESGDTSIKGRLQNDLSLGSVSFCYKPVGTIDNPFKGTFDGQGHIVSDLTITSDYTDYTALFGVLGSGAVIKRVVLDSSCSIDGGDGSAGIVGTVAASGSGSVTIAQCGNEATIKSQTCAGGVFGRNNNSSMTVNITNCYNLGSVTAPTYSGGLAGLLQTSDKIRYSFDLPTLTYYTATSAEKATERQFSQGFVTYRLNESQTPIWSQDISKDNRPLLFQTSSGVHYSRSDSGWNSLVLPFPVNSSDNVQLYSPSAIDGSYLKCRRISSCPANTPCLYYTEEEENVDLFNCGAVSCTTAEVVSSATDLSEWIMKGACYSRQTVGASSLSAATKRFTISNDCCSLATKAAYVYPYHCWLETTANEISGQYQLIDESVPTGIQVFSLSVLPSAKKILHNGQLLIISSGKTFNAAGQTIE